MKFLIRLFESMAWLFLGVIMLAVATSHTARADEVQRPLIAVMLSQCNGALAIYVVLDSTHTVLYRARDTVVMVVAKDGTVTESSLAPTDFPKAMELAKSAVIQQHVVAPCASGGVTI